MAVAASRKKYRNSPGRMTSTGLFAVEKVRRAAVFVDGSR
jgi:hypothetical protein